MRKSSRRTIANLGKSVGWALPILSAALVVLTALGDLRDLRYALNARFLSSLLAGILAIRTIQMLSRLHPPSRLGWPAYLYGAIAVAIASSMPFIIESYRLLNAADNTPSTSGTQERLTASTNLQDKSFTDLDLRGSNLAGTTIHNVDFLGADLSGSDFRRAKLIGVNLSGSSLCGVDFRGADLSQAIGIETVADWRYVFFDDQTRMPESVSLDLLSGPVKDTGVGLRYMCVPGETRIIPP